MAERLESFTIGITTRTENTVHLVPIELLVTTNTVHLVPTYYNYDLSKKKKRNNIFNLIFTNFLNIIFWGKKCLYPDLNKGCYVST